MLQLKFILPIGVAAGMIFYLVVACAVRKYPPNAHKLFEAMMGGGFFAGAVHLLYAAIFPEHLVHVRDAVGAILKPPAIQVELDGVHLLEITAAALFAMFGAALALRDSVHQKHH